MNVVLWILQGLLAAVLLVAGSMKLMRGKQKLLENPRMGWVEDFGDPTIRTIGALEVAAAIGVTLPWLLDIAPVLTGLASAGVVAIQPGAIVTHRAGGRCRCWRSTVRSVSWR